MFKIRYLLIFLSLTISQDCEPEMEIIDCDGTVLCNNSDDANPWYGYDCLICEGPCADALAEPENCNGWLGDGWCDNGEWGADFQCEEFSYDCGDCGDLFTDLNGYCEDVPELIGFEHNGDIRNYQLYLPDSLEDNAPLVFVMHGFTGSASGIYGYAGMNTIAEENGFAVCYPNGMIDQSGNRFWNVGYNFHQNQTVDDVDFLSSLAQYLQQEYNLSIENTFASGMSNGAEMSYMLACEAGEIFKAIAPVAGTMFGTSWTSCTPQPTPVLEIHGTNDYITLWDGDLDDTFWGPYPGIEEVIDYWVDFNNCTNSEDVTLLNFSTIKHRYFDCVDNVEVWLYEVVNGGHDWPNYSSQEIWNFFSQYLSISGDINEDTLINILDVIIIVNMILGDIENQMSADLNQDGIVNIIDIIQLVNIILDS